MPGGRAVRLMVELALLRLRPDLKPPAGNSVSELRDRVEMFLLLLPMMGDTGVDTLAVLRSDSDSDICLEVVVRWREESGGLDVVLNVLCLEGEIGEAVRSVRDSDILLVLEMAESRRSLSWSLSTWREDFSEEGGEAIFTRIKKDCVRGLYVPLKGHSLRVYVIF